MKATAPLTKNVCDMCGLSDRIKSSQLCPHGRDLRAWWTGLHRQYGQTFLWVKVFV